MWLIAVVQGSVALDSSQKGFHAILFYCRQNMLS